VWDEHSTTVRVLHRAFSSKLAGLGLRHVLIHWHGKKSK
jgi:hypothetical protein